MTDGIRSSYRCSETTKAEIPSAGWQGGSFACVSLVWFGLCGLMAAGGR